MKVCHVLDDDVLAQRGVDILIEKLGAVEATRFISMTVNRRSNSIKRHRDWQSKLNKTAFYKEVFADS